MQDRTDKHMATAPVSLDRHLTACRKTGYIAVPKLVDDALTWAICPFFTFYKAL
jgi:hypothetical protein